MTGLLSRCDGMERVVPMVPGEQMRMTLMMMTWFYYCWVLILFALEHGNWLPAVAAWSLHATMNSESTLCACGVEKSIVQNVWSSTTNVNDTALYVEYYRGLSLFVPIYLLLISCEIVDVPSCPS